MIQRTSETTVKQLAATFPVVVITGPRQSGKTTLAQKVFTGYNYCNLEHPEIRMIASEDPESLLQQYPPPVILDEVQRVPDLLSYIQVMVDKSKINGAFILTGSFILLMLAWLVIY